MSEIQVGTMTFKSPDALVRHARELVVRGGPFPPRESRLLGAAWPLLREAPLKTFADHELARAARAHHVVTPDKRERPATPLDARIEAAEKDVAAARARRIEAEAAMFEAKARATQVQGGVQWDGAGFTSIGPRTSASEGAQVDAGAREREAEGEYRRAANAETAARGKLSNLRRRADHWINAQRNGG